LRCALHEEHDWVVGHGVLDVVLNAHGRRPVLTAVKARRCEWVNSLAGSS
jgi:hypothetical protein